MSHHYSESAQRLFRAIADLRTPEECRDFFEDLCTIKEIHDMSQRLEIAVLLDQGYNYVKISEAVGVSAATITRVNRALNYGADGYRMALDRINEEERPNDD